MTPGVCGGEGVDCSARGAEAFETAPEVACEPEDAGTGLIDWTAEVGDIECPLGTCEATPTGLVAGADGSVWVVSRLSGPTSSVSGLGLARFDTDGQRTLALVADFRAPVAGSAPPSAGMRVDARGHLLWVAPIPGRPGLELRDYDAEGVLVGERPLVDWALSGAASIEEDGSLRLLYEHPLTPSASATAGDPSRSPWAVGLARFDAGGELVWNQTAPLGLEGGLKVRGAGATFGPDATIVHGSLAMDVTAARLVFSRVDADGTVAWVREIPDAYLASALAAPDDSVVVSYGSSSSPGAPGTLALVGPDGTSRGSWALAGAAPTGIDQEGRTWGSWRDGERSLVVATSLGGARCARWLLDVGGCTTTTDPNGGTSTTCTELMLVPTPNGRGAVFAAGKTVGLARFEGAP